MKSADASLYMKTNERICELLDRIVLEMREISSCMLSHTMGLTT